MPERNGVLITGTIMLVAAVVLPFVVWAGAGGTLEDAIVAVIFTFIFAPLLFIVGLVLVIVGFARGGGQQQQQQVVVMDRDQAQRRGFIKTGHCTQCGAGLGGGERFCTSCGVRVADG